MPGADTDGDRITEDENQWGFFGVCAIRWMFILFEQEHRQTESETTAEEREEVGNKEVSMETSRPEVTQRQDAECLNVFSAGKKSEKKRSSGTFGSGICESNEAFSSGKALKMFSCLTV